MHCFYFFFFNDTATTEIYTLSLHDALPISGDAKRVVDLGKQLNGLNGLVHGAGAGNSVELPAALEEGRNENRSEEHTSELQSPCNLVCRLLLEKKKYVAHHHRR